MKPNEVGELDNIRRFVVNAKDPKSVINLDDYSPAELLRHLAKVHNFKLSEIGDKLYIDFNVKEEWGAVTQPTRPDAVKYPAGYVARSSDNNLSKYATTGSSSAPPLVSGPDNTKLSENFTLGEFKCHDRQRFPQVRVSPKLVELLEKIRAKVGPLHITSGYRPPDYNREIGGASQSTHIDGLAADIYSNEVSTKTLCEVADQIVGNSGGVGFYPESGFVHVDVRGYASRW